MNKLLIGTSLLIASLLPMHVLTSQSNENDKEGTTKATVEVTKNLFGKKYAPPINPVELYEEMGLEEVIEPKAFEQAVEGLKKINPENRDVITLIDYSKSSKEERMYVLDLKEKKILYSTHVLHGAKSGYEIPTTFSNEVGSNKSSLGFFLTENTYNGKFGYALRLAGQEKGINDKAKERAIVIHGSKYASPKVLKTAKRIPRSEGCPAIPYDIKDELINVIKGGSLVYIYADNDEYVNKSNIVSGNSFFS